MPIDYSKWKTIEVSDDEDDTHPNIDTPSLYRWRHQARLERMAEMKQQKEEVESKKATVKSRVDQIDEELAKCTEETARIKLELEKSDIKKQEEEFMRKEKELADKERLAPWNVDTIGREAWSKSIINKPSEKKPEPAPKNEDEESERMMKYFKDNEELLIKYAKLKGFNQCEKFLLEHPHLSSEFATSYLTIEALNLAIDENYDEMALYASNCITLQYLLELAKSLHAVPTNTNIISTFFKKIRAADESYMKMYHDEVDSFKERLTKRAKTKRELALAEAESEEKTRRIQESPGGMDPQEVFESLPESMQEAFQSQSVGKLQEIATTMDSEVFQYHLNRCIASGLWVPNAKDVEEPESSTKS
ncbi:Hsp90 chaperone protein kinase-targeting subunit [Aphelenchoides besseyi]|nr:Hsp90 chaperone protein kinase-targeting subunit [Aphelenchoides besseyi]